jgi:hypothetical protein
VARIKVEQRATRSALEIEAEGAERARLALVQCALEAYEDALARGLCAEGAWEAAVGAMRKLDLGERG